MRGIGWGSARFARSAPYSHFTQQVIVAAQSTCCDKSLLFIGVCSPCVPMQQRPVAFVAQDQFARRRFSTQSRHLINPDSTFGHSKIHFHAATSLKNVPSMGRGKILHNLLLMSCATLLRSCWGDFRFWDKRILTILCNAQFLMTCLSITIQNLILIWNLIFWNQVPILKNSTHSLSFLRPCFHIVSMAFMSLDRCWALELKSF